MASEYPAEDGAAGAGSANRASTAGNRSGEYMDQDQDAVRSLGILGCAYRAQESGSLDWLANQSQALRVASRAFG